MRDYLAQPIQGGDSVPHPISVCGRFKRIIAWDNFKKQHGITMVIGMLLTAWTLTTCTITGTIVKHNTAQEVREQMSTQYAVELQNYKNQLEEDRRRENFLSGDASKQEAIKENAKYLACIGQGVLNTYQGADLDDARKVMICAVCRVHSGGEFAGTTSIKDAVTAKNQWWGYSENMVYSDEVYQVALEISTMFENNDPTPCSTDMVYAAWNGYEIVLRNRWEDNSSAKHY